MIANLSTRCAISAVAAAVLSMGLLGCSRSDVGGDQPEATVEVDTEGENVGGAATTSEGEPAGSSRDEMREAIATWYLEEGPSETRPEAECVADAMLDSVTVEELADLGVTIETIDELYLGPLRDNEEFFDRVFTCGLEFS